MIYHFLNVYLQKSEQQINNDTYNSTSSIGLHNWLIKTVFDEFNDRSEANDFNTKINELKTLRKKSDYQNRIIQQNEAEKARDTAYETLNIIKRNFNL
ncbi:MAG: hypothetical protein V5804_15035 [Mucilaginibacter sp.]|uniref:hypothetical protein n=1 Tax=Mucilaginibacter sp. TaxID=1882438 RepID=UPI0034E50E48